MSVVAERWASRTRPDRGRICPVVCLTKAAWRLSGICAHSAASHARPQKAKGSAVDRGREEVAWLVMRSL